EGTLDEAAPSLSDDIIVAAKDVTVRFGKTTVLDKLSLEVKRGEILGFVGASGSGKSVLLRTILGLIPKTGGTISMFGQDLAEVSEADRIKIDMRQGVLFQHGALFSSLSVLENIQ